MARPTSHILIALRRNLSGLAEGNEKQQLLTVLEEQAGLIVRLAKAAEHYTGEDDPMAISSALFIGIHKARMLQTAGKKTTYSLSHLAVLLAAKLAFGMKQRGNSFMRSRHIAIEYSCDDADASIPVLVDIEDPLLRLEAMETAASLDPLAVSSAFSGAEIEAINTQEAAEKCGITDRAMRYRMAKARARRDVGNQGDLFGEV